MKIKYLGTTLNANGQKAIARAKSYHGPDKTETFNGYIIKYKDGAATIIPMESYSVSVAMPNPAPYRGVSIGVVAGSVVSRVITGGQGSEWNILIDSAVYSSQTGSLTGTPPGFNTWTNFLADYIGSWPGYVANGISGGGGAAIPSGYPGAGRIPSISTYPDTSGTLVITPLAYHAGWIAAQAQATATNPTTTKVMASDGEVLASEVQTHTTGSGAATYYAPPIFYDAQTVSLISGAWNGGSNLWMYMFPDGSYNVVFNHKLNINVPEDCIYPTPSPLTPTTLLTYNGTPDGLDADWNADWQAGVTAFKARRKAWFLKNSTEFIAALKGKFQPGAAGVTRAELQSGKLPASWDYAIKTHCITSYKTYQPILMNASYVDAVISDTSADLTQAGTMVTKRTVTFNYVDAAGVFQQKVIDGTQIQTVSALAAAYGGGPGQQYPLTTWDLWYELGVPEYSGTRVRPEARNAFYTDRTLQYLGALWTGAEQSAPVQANGDSAWNGLPGDAIINSDPHYPLYSNTLVGTAPDFVLNYHNTVLPKYHSETPSSTHDGNTAWNNSGMYGVKSVSLRLFGPVAQDGTLLGIFPDPSDADGATSVAYYGKATFSFDWSTGTITPTSWAEQTPPTVAALPAGYSYFTYSSTLYFVGPVKTTIAGNGQTPTAAGIAASTAVSNGLPYTAAAKAAAANAIQAAVAGAAPVDGTVSPLVASPANIAAVLPTAVTGAVAAVLSTYTSSPPDATLVKYRILYALGTLHAASNTAISYGYGASAMWPDVTETVTTDIKNMTQTDPLRALILSL